MKRYQKIILFLVGGFLFLTLLVQFPNLFIKKQLVYQSFEIYSNETIELDKYVKNILDSVQTNLNKSQFQTSESCYELYFVQGTLYEYLIRFFGRKNIAFSKFNKHIYSAKPYFEDSVLKKSDHPYEWLNLVQIISHETIHSQMYKDYSSFGMMQTPSWINEGYSEYIAYQPIRDRKEYHLSDLMNRLENNLGDWIQTEHGAMTPRQYLKDRLLLEYLIDIKGMTILEIINDQTIDPGTVLKEIEIFFREKQS